MHCFLHFPIEKKLPQKPNFYFKKIFGKIDNFVRNITILDAFCGKFETIWWKNDPAVAYRVIDRFHLKNKPEYWMHDFPSFHILNLRKYNYAWTILNSSVKNCLYDMEHSFYTNAVKESQIIPENRNQKLTTSPFTTCS